MFKVGDIVWSKIHNYSVTFYHRPCRVLSCLGSEIRVRVIDNGSTYNVDATKFELVPEGGMLYPGDKLIHSKTREILIFEKYYECDFIKCRNSDNDIKDYKIQDVERFRKVFYV